MNLFAEQPEKIVYTLNRMAVPMVAQTKYRNTYGIDVYRRGYKLYEVKDITVDREKLENLIRLCNQEQLLPAAFTGCGRRLFDLPLENEDIL